ncbi:MAG: alpha-amylase family glycosyl hydrolase [bacterium]
MRIPAPNAATVELRVADVLERDRFGERWRYTPLVSAPDGFWEIDVASLGLADGTYEYEFVVDGKRDAPVADPFAEEITRFGGYRGILRIRSGKQQALPFDWSDELPPQVALPENHRMVIYEMPLRWMEGETGRQVGLGTFEEVVFAHLDRLRDLGFNCIELLPIQDSPDTLNWGYGSRFFFAPDFDMGAPIDLKLFVKRCHQRGIRVILDVVMNHAKECPLLTLAENRYFIHKDEEGRDSEYGGRMFRYRDAVDGHHWAREFHFRAAAFWIETYRIDGFRIDEFKGINHWEFVQEFRDRAWQTFRARFPGRPFIVIAEDSWMRTEIVRDEPTHPHGRKVVDAMWNFSYRDEIRRALLNDIVTVFGQPARRERIAGFVSGSRRWDDLSKRVDGGFGDMAQSVAYVTSHDVEHDGEQRLMNQVLSSLLRYFGRGDGSFQNVRNLSADMLGSRGSVPSDLQGLYQQALDRVRAAYALLMTSVGIPMVLAGEEFADIHDVDHHDWRVKMSDPVDWGRRFDSGHAAVATAISDLVWLRHGHPALHRNEVEFFHFHPTIDENDGRRVFAYCRTAGASLGSAGQVVTIANLGGDDYPSYEIPWPWTGAWSERGPRPGAGSLNVFGGNRAALPLAPFDVRVFETY